LRLLYIATSFPAPENGATIYTDLAEALHEAGHEVVVVVADQSRRHTRTGVEIERGMEVLRVGVGDYYDVGFVRKGVTSLLMPTLLRRSIRKHLLRRQFDLILFESPPVTNAGLIAWARRAYGCPAYLMLKDIFPQNAVDLGIMGRNGLVYRYYRAKEQSVYSTADYIGCMSPANRRYVLDHNPWLDPNKVELFPNTKKLASSIDTGEYRIRPRYGIPMDACVFLFGGNMGRPQYVDLVCRAITRLANDPRVYFLCIGRGTDRYKLERVVNTDGVRNALVLSHIPRDEYDQVVKESDVGLVVLDPRFTIPNFPSRILSYMEYAKPVLAATDRVTDLRDLITEASCGRWVWSGDLDAFIDAIVTMAHSNDLRVIGENGRRYAQEHFDVARSVAILERHFAD